MRIDGPQVTSSLSLNGTTITDLNVFVTTASFNGLTGSYATTGSNLFNGTQTLSGSILPSVNNTYDLGSPTQQFRHVYISSGSLYVNGTKVLGSTEQELQITTDGGQSFKILESGSDTITLQSVDGNVTLTSSGQGDIVLDPTTGIIGLKGTVTVYTGNKITSSDGNLIQFGNGIAVTGSIVSTVTPLVSGSSQVLNGSGVWSGSAQLPSGIISGSAQLPSGIVSSSLQVTGYGFATTGSNAFIGTQTITGSLYISSDLVVQGSSSLQDITASVVNIGANIVNLNTANPAIRFAGLNIFDSGSIGGSGSFLYDAVQDEFIFVHRGDNANITSSVALMGPQTYNNIGNEIYPTANRILKGTGNEHVGDSIISETGGGIGISGNLSITGSVLVGVDKGIIFDTSGASGNPEISIDSNVDLNFKNTAGLTNLKLKNNGDIVLNGSLTGTTATFSGSLAVVGAASFSGTTGNRLTLYNGGNNGGINGLLIDSDIYPGITFNSRLTTSGAIIGGGKIIYNSIATGYGSNSLGGALLLQADNAMQFSTGGDNVRMSITSVGATTFSCEVTAVGDIRSNAIFRDYQGEALMTTSGSENQFGSFGASTPRSVKIFAGNQVALTIDTNRCATFAGPLNGTSALFCGNIGITCTSAKFYQLPNNCKSADSVLDIYNTASNGFGVSIQAGANNNNYALAVSNFQSTPLLYVAGNGQVGIGCGTPNAKLTINNGNSFSSIRIYGTNPSYISQLGWYDSTNLNQESDGVGGGRVALIEIGTVAGSGTGCRGANMGLYTHEANGSLKQPLLLMHNGNVCLPQGNLYTTCTLFAPGTPIQIVTGTANTTSGSSGSSASLGTSAGGASPTYNAGCLITSVSFTPKSASSKILIQTNSVALWETQNVADHFYLWAANDSAGNVLTKSGGYLPLFGSGLHGAIINLNGTANSWGTSTNTISFRIGTSGGPGDYYQWNPWYGAGGFNSDTVGHFSYTIMEIAQ
jgi:hypothetical protein